MPEEYAGKIRSKKDAENQIRELHDWHMFHNYNWFTLDVARGYYQRYQEFAKKNIENCGYKYELIREMQRIYGITEIEATNTLDGFHINDYVRKYERIRIQEALRIIEKSGVKVKEEE